MIKLVFADSTELEVLTTSNTSMIQFAYNAETFAEDLAHFTNVNVNGAQLQTWQTVEGEEEEELISTTLIQNKKLTGNITINSDVVTVSLNNMSTTESKILTNEQLINVCMDSIEFIFDNMLGGENDGENI